MHKLRLLHDHSKCQCHLFMDASKSDPTGTKAIRNTFEKALVARFRAIKSLINQAIVQNDVFGLNVKMYGDSKPNLILMDKAVPGQRAYSFNRPAEKVSLFMDWLQDQQNAGILEISTGTSVRRSAQSAWMNTYIDTPYQKAIRDAGNKMRKEGAKVSDRWIESAFNRPIHADRLGLIYTRAFTDLNGITQAMDQQISRVLAQGIGEGLGARDIARNLNERVDAIGITRARMLARTELVSAHAEASINAYEEAGLEGVDVEAEVLNGDDPCPICQELAQDGPYSLSEARGLLPAHPNCVCSLNPTVVNGSGINLV